MTVSFDSEVYDALQHVNLRALEENSRSSLINRVVRKRLNEVIDNHMKFENEKLNKCKYQISELQKIKEKLNY